MRVHPDEDLDALELGRWLGRVASAMRGRRGQAFLRKLEAALLALPQKRLIADAICQNGEVCMTGALILQQRLDAGMSRDDAMAEVSEAYNFEDEDWDEDEAVAIIEGECDVAYALAWEAIRINDDCSGTPEQRYDYCLRWVRRHLRTRDAVEAGKP